MIRDKADTVRGGTSSVVTGAEPAVVRWPEPSPLAGWWDEIMRHDHPIAAD
ncbi:hypothetical protein [Nocardia testacea]|uniref:hypothetical protein n=1 Tax=Nocardia testacea TaxID=248551 RepID=UPI0003066F29|nr:hypothetical protein [Nocardia testacea]